MILPSLNQTLHLHIASNINSQNYKDLQNDTHFQDNTERKWIEARERRKTKQKKRCYESKHTCILLFKSVTALKAASTAGEAGSQEGRLMSERWIAPATATDPLLPEPPPPLPNMLARSEQRILPLRVNFSISVLPSQRRRKRQEKTNNESSTLFDLSQHEIHYNNMG